MIARKVRNDFPRCGTKPQFRCSSAFPSDLLVTAGRRSGCLPVSDASNLRLRPSSLNQAKDREKYDGQRTGPTITRIRSPPTNNAAPASASPVPTFGDRHQYSKSVSMGSSFAARAARRTMRPCGRLARLPGACGRQPRQHRSHPASTPGLSIRRHPRSSTPRAEVNPNSTHAFFSMSRTMSAQVSTTSKVRSTGRRSRPYLAARSR